LSHAQPPNATLNLTTENTENTDKILESIIRTADRFHDPKHSFLCTTNIRVLAKKERIFQHHGMTVGIGIGIGIAIAVAIAIENRA